MLQSVLTALGNLRSPFALYEKDLHAGVAGCLEAAGLAYRHEASLGKGCRLDFLVGTVGIEVKKTKVSPSVLREQLTRYAHCPEVQALVVVTQYSVTLPRTIEGKPVKVVSISQNWGVALP